MIGQGAAIRWAGSSGLVCRGAVPVATFGPWAIAVSCGNGEGVVGDLTAPLVSGADRIEVRSGWTLDLEAGDGVRWVWADARMQDRTHWRVAGIPVMREVST